MRLTAIDRRTFLTLAAAAGIAARPGMAWSFADSAVYLTARKRGPDYEVAVIDEAGRDRLVIPLDARGHSFAVDRNARRAVAFARGPGRFGVAFDIEGKTEPLAFTSLPDRHFFGHGTFADNDRLLIATENDYEGARGVAGIYDVEGGFSRIGEFATGGLDPHEAVLLPDNKTLCIANGGVLTHPDYGKLELNLETMAPSLTYLDISTGDIVETATLDASLHKLAFHHLVVDGSGAVWFGCQYHGPEADRPPVVGRHRRGRKAELFTGPANISRGLKNYIGAVAVDRSGTIVATSSPYGGLVAYWDTATGRYLGSTEIHDGCGVAAGINGSFRLTSGFGQIVEAGPGNMKDPAPANDIQTADGTVAWDNHLIRVRAGPS